MFKKKKKKRSVTDLTWQKINNMLCRFKTFPCAAVEVKNEPILAFEKGSKERVELEKVNIAYTQALIKQQNLDTFIHLKAKICTILPGATRPERKDGGDSVCDRRRTDMDQRDQIPAICEYIRVYIKHNLTISPQTSSINAYTFH